jgi:hypothetical protein
MNYLNLKEVTDMFRIFIIGLRFSGIRHIENQL